jgi:hypothetical protein
MMNWKSLLKPDTLGCLLEKDSPSILYFTLSDLLDYSKTDSEVVEAKNRIMESKLVAKILSKQKDKGYWEKPNKFYKSK